MSNKEKKSRHTVRNILIVLLLLAIAGGGAFVYITRTNNLKPAEYERKDIWLASEGSDIELVRGTDTVERDILGRITKRTYEFGEGISLPRGTAAVLINDPALDEDGNVIYDKIEYGGEVYYILPESHADTLSECVKEKEKYVRTSVTIYQNEKEARIAGFARKGSKLDIIGYDELKADGSIEMYKVKYGDTEGFVFSKYLVDTQEEADSVYNVNGIADSHADDVLADLELYGGDPKKLDFYPCEKPVFEDNEFCEDVRAMYLSVACSYYIDSYIDVAKAHGVNAMVVDIRDDVVAFDADVVKEMSPNSLLYYGADDYPNMIKKIKDAGLYCIGRIVCFKNPWYAADHPEDCYPDYYGELIPSVYSRDVWYYNVQLAIEAVRKFGFDEIQFDYVRFDETAWYKCDRGDFNFGENLYNEDKCEAVQNFLFYATDMVHREGAYVSMDCFGEPASGYVCSYGQHWAAMSNIVDAISAMPYTDHFDRNPSLWEYPYYTLYNWGKGAAAENATIATPATIRTWITAYSVPYFYADEDKIYYGAPEVSDQAQGLWDAGCTGGFMAWNIACDVYRYDVIDWAWSKDYANSDGTIYRPWY